METLGELLAEMIKRLRTARKEKMGDTLTYFTKELNVQPSTIYKWRENELTPSLDRLEQLVEIGAAEAGMNREWAEKVLRRAQHPNRSRIIGTLFPQSIMTLPHNLPYRSYVRLIGREGEITEIMKRLSPESRHWIVPIEGIGGVGKSALALEVGWRLVENASQTASERKFDAIVWASAKREVLTVSGIERRHADLTNLEDIVRKIADVLKQPGIMSEPADRRTLLDQALREKRLLLILDNLESIEDPQVIRFLRDLPPPTKAIVTMRFNEDMQFPIRLAELNLEESRVLVQEECDARRINLGNNAIDSLLQHARGIPIAIWWAIGLIDMGGFSVENTLMQLASSDSPLQKFIFDEAIFRLMRKWPAALDVLKSLSFFDLEQGATDDALASTSGLELQTTESCRQQLVNLNLVHRRDAGLRFTILPLTQDYVRQQITKEWEAPARGKWLNFYYDFARRNLKREQPNQRYWNSLMRRGLDSIDPEWPNFQVVLDWLYVSDREEGFVDIIEMMMLLIHYMDRRVLFTQRLYYAQKAAEVAAQHGQKMDEALLRIDGLGWTLIEQNRLPAATQEISKGKEAAERIEDKSITHDLVALANAFLAKAYLVQDDLEQASRFIEDALTSQSKPMVQSRVLMVAGSVACRLKNYSNAVRFYQDAICLSESYGNEGNGDQLSDLLGHAFVDLGDYSKAETAFDNVLALVPHGSTPESANAEFGFARIAKARGDSRMARNLALSARKDIVRLVGGHRLIKEIDTFLATLDVS